MCEKIFSLILFTFLFIACGNNKETNKQFEEIVFNSQIKVDSTFIEINNPLIITNFNQHTDTLYDTNKQLYYNLNDFQGYYLAMCKPIIDTLGIKEINRANKNYLFVLNSGESIPVTRSTFKNQQGLIIFNPKFQPVFWYGNQSANLEIFLKSRLSKNDSITQK